MSLVLILLGGLATFIILFTIGANDVANIFSTLVGSNTLRLKYTLILGSICQIMGATIFKNAVTQTFLTRILDFDAYKEDPSSLMIGMTSCLIGSATWLSFATYKSFPVSTSLTIISSLVSFGLITSVQAIYWPMFCLVVSCWFIAPLISLVISTLTFIFVRKTLLTKSNAFQISIRWLLPLMLVITGTFSYFVIFYSPLVIETSCHQILLGKTEITEHYPCQLSYWAAANILKAILIVIIFSLTLCTICCMLIYPLALKKINTSRSLRKPINDDESTPTSSPDSTFSTSGIILESYTIDNLTDHQYNENKSSNFSPFKSEKTTNDEITLSFHRHLDSRFENMVKSSYKLTVMHQDIEVFEYDIEILFSYSQIISISLATVAHAINDTANALSPFVILLFTYSGQELIGYITVPWYIFIVGGISMSMGFCLYGHQVFATFGLKLISMTPSRGFLIDLSSSWVMMICNALGFPISSCQCILTSALGIGVSERGNSPTIEKPITWDRISKHIYIPAFKKIIFFWVVDFFASGLLTILIYEILRIIM